MNKYFFEYATTLSECLINHYSLFDRIINFKIFWILQYFAMNIRKNGLPPLCWISIIRLSFKQYELLLSSLYVIYARVLHGQRAFIECKRDQIANNNK